MQGRRIRKAHGRHRESIKVTERASGRTVNPPTGTVTFLFTDIEKSTYLWDNYPLQMEGALARHNEILTNIIEAHEGYVFKTVGDAYCAAFASSRAAALAALAAQRALLAEPWENVCRIRVRMALHTGAATERGGDYFGPPVNRVARLMSAGHGGQILLSDVTYGLARDILVHLEPGAELRYLGEHRLRDLKYTERIFQLVVPDLPSEFPKLKTRGIVSATPPAGMTPPNGEAAVVTDKPAQPSATTPPEPEDADTFVPAPPEPDEEIAVRRPPANTQPPKRDVRAEDARDRRKLINGRYELVRPIGGGGMAEVYLARDEVLERNVAMKVLRGQYADDEAFVERFRREARNAAALSHPNIVAIHDQGRTEDGLYYIVMEHVDGGTLHDLIQREGALSPDRIVEITIQIAQALQVAHEGGMVHRDVKPQNVLITKAGEAKVGDFGIARATTATRLTQEGSVMGTAQYISPEQALGQDASPRSDLYSLGIVLHEMLTGELPFDADTLAGIVMSHVSGKLRSPKEANPRVPEELNAITVRLTDKDPDRRYPDAAALKADLERIRQGTPPQGIPLPGDPGEVGQPTRQPTRPAGGGSATGMNRNPDPPAAPVPVQTGATPGASPRPQEGAAPQSTPVPGPGGMAPGVGTPPRGAQPSPGGAPQRRLWPWIAAAGLVVVVALAGIGVWALGLFPVTGTGTASVPSLAGQTLQEARATVGDDFEVVGEEDYSGDVIVSQDPQCGAEAPQGSEISVTFGSNDPSLVEVPDLTGRSVEEARAALESGGLNLGNQRQESSGEPRGQVVSQDPPACSLTSRDTPVSVSVSGG